MVNIHVAYSERINPSGASSTLTREQIWKGLERKVRRAHDFVPLITKTDVVEDKGDEVTRVAHFEGRSDGETQVKEVCKLYPPTKVDFHQPNGALITNTVSDGPALDGKDLIMTYTFEWRYPDVEQGSEKHKELLERHRTMGKMAVHSSIEALRRMAGAGELGS